MKDAGEKFSNTINLEELFDPLIKKFQRKKLIFEKIDNNNINWKFELISYTMKDYLYYRQYLEDIKILNDDNYTNVLLTKPLLYITNIYRNNEKIDDWEQTSFIDKFIFFNKLPSEIIMNVKNINSDDFLINFILNNFDEEKIESEIKNYETTCENCNEKYFNIYNFDEFFYVLGYSTDNQEIYSNILETETYLIYHHWLTIDQINNLSYLDFSIYSERIFGLYEEEQKQKEEEMKNAENQVQQIEIISL